MDVCDVGSREAPLRHILSKMIELIMTCSWDVLLDKEPET